MGQKTNPSRIVIERTLKLITVTIYAARPGFIIGKGGTEVDKLKEELKKVTKKDVQINIYEVKRPEVDANIVADSIARQIEGRVSYRRAIKMAIANTMRVGAEGIKIQIAGRVGGAEIASESRCGSATVSAMASRILLLPPSPPPTRRLPARTVAVAAVATVVPAGMATATVVRAATTSN